MVWLVLLDPVLRKFEYKIGTTMSARMLSKEYNVSKRPLVEAIPRGERNEFPERLAMALESGEPSCWTLQLAASFFLGGAAELAPYSFTRSRSG